ncbi:MAG TPA: YmaF family protein [Bacilli bacterium]|nr:YmaF family protein [Bacilli bacterium]
MNQSVFGILCHADQEQEGDTHAHRIILITWDGRDVHVHDFAGSTSFDVGHDHRYAGTTEPAPSGVPHVHRYVTITSLDQGHTHVIQGVTGPAIPLSGGGHYHFFEGRTTVNGRTPHTHTYRGRTSGEL